MADPKGTPVSHAGVKGQGKGAGSRISIGHEESSSPLHVKETHGRSDDIDENTRVEDVKGPSIIQRVKEEVEAIAESVLHPKHKDRH
ncbi:hypothetical protein M569_17394 [Genlisea aurea]|uniref:Uncharacterized protein n=1 Tax=Genlisea aurea TaxID=192259 RepID=S8BSS1_9LAMI|nr:hypothetical protein M569_17394 [Genlisea aurea]